MLSLNKHLDLHRVSTHMMCLTTSKEELKLKGAAVATVVVVVVVVVVAVVVVVVSFTSQLIN